MSDNNRTLTDGELIDQARDDAFKALLEDRTEAEANALMERATIDWFTMLFRGPPLAIVMAVNTALKLANVGFRLVETDAVSVPDAGADDDDDDDDDGDDDGDDDNLFVRGTRILRRLRRVQPLVAQIDGVVRDITPSRPGRGRRWPPGDEELFDALYELPADLAGDFETAVSRLEETVAVARETAMETAREELEEAEARVRELRRRLGEERAP